MPSSPFYEAGQPYVGPPLLTRDSPSSARWRPPTDLIDPDVVVIGSGVGGLSVASLLSQRRGLKVLVLEAAPVPGGCTHCHEIDGFEFNSGIDSVGDMDRAVGRGINRDTADVVTGGGLLWARMPEVHEVCTFGDERYEWFSSPERNIAWVEQRFAGQGDVRRYYDIEHRVERASTGWGLTKVLPAWIPEGLREQVFKLSAGDWRRYMHRDTWSVLRGECGFSDELAAVFSYMYGNHGKPPDAAPFGVHAITMHHYRHGAFYPVGGPGQVAECVRPIVEAAGGQIAVSSPVERILVEGGRAVGVQVGGRAIRAKQVVSDASAWTTFAELLEPEVAAPYLRRLAQVHPSPAHVHLMLGYDEEIQLPRHIIWSMHAYADVGRYAIGEADRRYKGERRWRGMAGYILSPSARDPAWRLRRPGQSTVCALAEAPGEWVTRARQDPAFAEDLLAGMREGMLEMVLRELPELRGRSPRVCKLSIPVGCNPRAWQGCSYGIEGSGERFVEHTHWLRCHTDIPGLWLTGQDAFAPGFAGAIVGGRACYSAMTGDLLFMLV